MQVEPISSGYYGRVYPALHCKGVLERELQYFIAASDAGLTPKFRGYMSLEFPGTYDMYSDAWDADLSDEFTIGFSEQEVDALTEALLRLPGMLHSLHLLGIAHRDIAGRNVMIRREKPYHWPRFSVAFIDFGHSRSYSSFTSSVLPSGGYDKKSFEEDVKEDNMDLRRLLCDFGAVMGRQSRLGCKIESDFVCPACEVRKSLYLGAK